MEDVTKEVKQFVLDRGMDLVGIASADRLNELTPGGYISKRETIAQGIRTVTIVP